MRPRASWRTRGPHRTILRSATPPVASLPESADEFAAARRLPRAPRRDRVEPVRAAHRIDRPAADRARRARRARARRPPARHRVRAGVHESAAAREHARARSRASAASPRPMPTWSSGTTATTKDCGRRRSSRGAPAGTCFATAARAARPRPTSARARIASSRGFASLPATCSLFSSAHVLRVLAARWLGLPPQDARCFVLGTASLSALGYEHTANEPVIRFWNEAARSPMTVHARASDRRRARTPTLPSEARQREMTPSAPQRAVGAGRREARPPLDASIPRDDTMKATARLHDLGQSLWLDNITRDLLESGTLARYIAELSVTGLTSNPTIFDHAIKGSSDYDAAIREQAQGRQVRRERSSSSSRSRTSRARRICSGRSTTARAASTAGCRWRSRRCSRTTRRRRSPPRADLSRARRAAQPLHQDPRHEGGAAGDRGGDLRRRARQRHAAVLARALPRGRRRVPARHRAPDRRGPRPGRRLGGVAVHQPLGRRRRGQGAARAREQARHRDRAARVQGVLRPGRRRRAIAA